MAKVLVIEDDPQIAMIVQIKLKNNGFDVVIAKDGGAGLAAAKEQRPDMILLDVMIPVMDGYQVLRAVRSDPDLQHTPVIMLTAKGQERDILAGFKDGATDYIVKPFSPSEVVARVQRLIQ